MNEKPLKDVSILLVEDNEMNTLLASAIIERTGAYITQADNGMDAINLLKKRSFDIVLMDLHMPVMNGFDTTKLIRKELAMDIPIIAVTANVINEEEKKCLDAGMNGFISKPYTEKALLDKIAAFLPAKKIADETSTAPESKASETTLYDLSMLKSITKDNDALLQRMLQIFISEVPAAVKKIQEAYTQLNFTEVASIMHSIKPNIESVSIGSLKNTVQEIELLSTLNQASEPLTIAIQKLEATITIAIQQIKEKELV